MDQVMEIRIIQFQLALVAKFPFQIPRQQLIH